MAGVVVVAVVKKKEYKARCGNREGRSRLGHARDYVYIRGTVQQQQLVMVIAARQLFTSS